MPSTSLKTDVVPYGIRFGSITELDALALHLTRRRFHIVAPEGNVQRTARLHSVAELKEHNPGVGAGNSQLEPSLFLAERLIRQEAEAEDLGIERQRPVLIGHRNADELDALDHARIVGATERALQEGRFNNYYSDMHHIAVNNYVVDVLLPDLAGHDRSPSAFLV